MADFEESIRGFLAQGAYPWMAPYCNMSFCHTRACLHF
jgi:hypothetical protein